MVTYQGAREGGHYVVAYGAVLIGVGLFLESAFRWGRYKWRHSRVERVPAERNS
jgi:hypothetical protein